jgi:hypothetical protein
MPMNCSPQRPFAAFFISQTQSEKKRVLLILQKRADLGPLFYSFCLASPAFLHDFFPLFFSRSDNLAHQRFFFKGLRHVLADAGDFR